MAESLSTIANGRRSSVRGVASQGGAPGWHSCAWRAGGSCSSASPSAATPPKQILTLANFRTWTLGKMQMPSITFERSNDYCDLYLYLILSHPSKNLLLYGTFWRLFSNQLGVSRALLGTSKKSLHTSITIGAAVSAICGRWFSFRHICI